jgi:mono/diheme cytochrome c family protein
VVSNSHFEKPAGARAIVIVRPSFAMTLYCRHWIRLFTGAFAFLLVEAAWPVRAAEPDPARLPAAATRPIDFVRDVLPIFSENCHSCHGAKRSEANFRLDSKDIALKGGDLGPAILPGQSAKSLLVQAVAGVNADLVMPKKGDRLTPEQVGLIRAWIDQGAQWPDSASVKVVDNRNHWAFKAPVRPVPPAVKNRKWVRNPIDNFILGRLERERLTDPRGAQTGATSRRRQG